MVMDVLSAADRQKIDGSDDALFYAEPRFVQHLDAAFRARLTELYRERIPQNAVVLDLMSSWVSHLPEDGTYAEVIGHGLNARELEANPRLSRHWVQNLNTNQHLPLADASVDAALVVAGWQYLQQPEGVAAELLRVVRPGGGIDHRLLQPDVRPEGPPDLAGGHRPRSAGQRGPGADRPGLAPAGAAGRSHPLAGAPGVGGGQGRSLLRGDRHGALGTESGS